MEKAPHKPQTTIYQLIFGTITPFVYNIYAKNGVIFINDLIDKHGNISKFINLKDGCFKK